jgi:D-xylose transport system permease protein
MEAAAKVKELEDPNKQPGLLGQIARGELGELRVLFGLALIWTIFQIANDRFLTSGNLTNLSLQITAVGTISIGVVLVLLLGEIDLSVGAVSGLAASVMAALTVNHAWSPELAILAGLGVGAAIGLFNGLMVTVVGIPSFIVTLAASLAIVGAQLDVLSEQGTINIPQGPILDLTQTFYDPIVGWILAIAVTAGTLGLGLLERRRRQRAGLELPPSAGLFIRTALIGIGVFAAVWVLSQNDRGIPLALLILVGLCGIFAFITYKTRFGRHIYAVGGNAEAARRAGINVKKVRILVFTLASTLAAAGGILAASRLFAVNQGSGAGDLLLLAIAGPVIAGVSLFGGRGTVWAALLGALVIGSISNGMDLLGLESSVKYMITGGVLLAAVTIDALTRRQRQQASFT